MDIDTLIKATILVFSSVTITAFIYWWSWFTVDKIHNRGISMIVFFIPIIPALVSVAYFVLVNI